MQPEQKVNVLVVDDHPENLLALEAILERVGENLVLAKSGESALKCLLNQDFAVILLDVEMPGIDGFETATLIRGRERSRHTPIIFLTAHSTNDSLMFKGYSLGAVDYMIKPFDPEILISKVGVFIELFKKTQEVQRQATQLEKANKELEQQLQESQRLTQELEAFAYSVSHDLRTPLRSIEGFSQIVIEDYGEKLDEDGKNYLERIRAASQRMAQLIEDLLLLSRMTRSELRSEMVNLSELAQAIATQMQETQPERQVQFIIAPELFAKGDARLLRVALENLLGNAWKYTSKQEVARIEFGVIRSSKSKVQSLESSPSLSPNPPARNTYFVRDDGAGFDMAYADKLFGVFQRLHPPHEFEGTGIGLAIVQRIIHRHGGKIWAEGSVGRGATFYFVL